MKLDVLSLSKTMVGKKDLPRQFTELVRPDLIKRAIEVIQANRRQPYGAKLGAGMRASAELSRRRKDYRGSYGHGISRVQRKILSRRGTNLFWVGAVVPGTVGGRRAHPPKAEKILSKKINKKEKRKAIRSAISATVIRNLVEQRGHDVPKEYPFIIESKFEDVVKTKSVITGLDKLGLKKEIERVSKRKIRPGIGKLRGRKHRTKKGPLIVVSKTCPLMKTATNITGIDVVEVHNLNTELLAPGTDYGRMTLFTEAAIDRLAKEGLFMNDYKGPKIEKEKAKKTESAEKKPAPKSAKKETKKSAEQKTEAKPAVKKAEK